jgi:hypothetical protein
MKITFAHQRPEKGETDGETIETSFQGSGCLRGRDSGIGRN